MELLDVVSIFGAFRERIYNATVTTSVCWSATYCTVQVSGCPHTFGQIMYSFVYFFCFNLSLLTVLRNPDRIKRSELCVKCCDLSTASYWKSGQHTQRYRPFQHGGRFNAAFDPTSAIFMALRYVTRMRRARAENSVASEQETPSPLTQMRDVSAVFTDKNPKCGGINKQRRLEPARRRMQNVSGATKKNADQSRTRWQWQLHVIPGSAGPALIRWRWCTRNWHSVKVT